MCTVHCPGSLPSTVPVQWLERPLMNRAECILSYSIYMMSYPQALRVAYTVTAPLMSCLLQHTAQHK